MAPGSPDPATLSGIFLFQGVPPEDLPRLAASFREKSLPAGVQVIAAEQPGEAVYVVLRGSVKVCMEQPDGAEVILAVLGPGELVGEMSLADSLGRSASVLTSKIPLSCGWIARLSSPAWSRCPLLLAT